MHGEQVASDVLRGWNMIRLRSLIAAALMCVAFAAPVSAAPVPVLGGTTVLRASRPVSVDVRLPRAATVATPFGSSPDLSFAGSGRLSAFVLTGTAGPTRGVNLVGGAAGPEGDRFLMPVPDFPGFGGGSFEQIKTFADVTTIPAGAYRLYVIPDGGPVQFTLRLRGVAGRVTLAPSRAAAAEIAPADPVPASSPASGSAFVGSAARELRGRGFALHVLHAEVEAAAAWQLMMCHNNGDRSIPEVVRRAPGCPNGEKHTFVDHRAPEPEADEKFFVQGFAGLSAGEHGLSAVYTNQGYVPAVRYLTLWLNY